METLDHGKLNVCKAVWEVDVPLCTRRVPEWREIRSRPQSEVKVPSSLVIRCIGPKCNGAQCSAMRYYDLVRHTVLCAFPAGSSSPRTVCFGRDAVSGNNRNYVKWGEIVRSDSQIVNRQVFSQLKLINAGTRPNCP